MPVAAPADKRFRRSHVHPGKKRRWMPSWRTIAGVTVIAGVAIVGIWKAAGLALNANALTVSRITVTGTNWMAPGEALAVLDGLRGESMVTVDLEHWRRKLLDAPWVADATMRLVFPGGVAVEIVEREPLGIGRIRDSLYLIDRQGAVIEEFGPKYAEFDLPMIDGLMSGGGDKDGAADDARAVLAGRLLADFQRRPDLARLVSQVDVSNANDAIVILKDDTALIHTGDDNFVERVQTYLELAPRMREDVPQIDYVDMRFGERIAVKGRSATGR